MDVDVRGGGNRTVRSVITGNLPMSMIICVASLLTRRIMFISCVLVTNAMRWGARTCVGSDASQIGVSLEKISVPAPARE